MPVPKIIKSFRNTMVKQYDVDNEMEYGKVINI